MNAETASGGCWMLGAGLVGLFSCLLFPSALQYLVFSAHALKHFYRDEWRLRRLNPRTHQRFRLTGVTTQGLYRRLVLVVVGSVTVGWILSAVGGVVEDNYM